MDYNNKNYYLNILIAICNVFILTSCLGDSNSSTSPAIDTNLLELSTSFSELSTFSEYADSVNLDAQFRRSEVYTLITPTNDAFEELPSGLLDTLSQAQLTEILTYHLANRALFANELSNIRRLQSVQGDSLFFSYSSIQNKLYANNAELVAGNYQATNGILHATSKVLFPDSYLDITGLIEKRFMLNAFNNALEDTDIKATLETDSEEGYTVLAPNNTAFDGFAPGNINALQDTLKYHIIPQKLTSEALQGTQTFETLNGQQVEISHNNGTITVNGEATIIIIDIEGTNGVMHIINHMLVPPLE